jgi:hypothetical protein
MASCADGGYADTRGFRRRADRRIRAFA